MSYGHLPCRQCGLPTVGNYNYETDVSFCCSRPKCIKKDDEMGLTDQDKPLKTVSKKKWIQQQILDSRGY